MLTQYHVNIIILIASMTTTRDLLLASSQQSNELKDALDSENEKTIAMEASMAKLDVEMKRSDDLLSQVLCF